MPPLIPIYLKQHVCLVLHCFSKRRFYIIPWNIMHNRLNVSFGKYTIVSQEAFGQTPRIKEKDSQHPY